MVLLLLALQALQDITPNKGILEESKQQPATGSPHRTRFVPAPIVKASSGPLPTPLAQDSPSRGSQYQQASAVETSRPGQHGAGNENDVRYLQTQQPLPSRAAPTGTAVASRLGNEELRQADALVQATRSSSNAGVAGIIARFEPSQAVPAEPAAAEGLQTDTQPGAFQPLPVRPAAEQAAHQPQLLGHRPSDINHPQAMHSQYSAGPSDAGPSAQAQPDMRAPSSQSAQPQEASIQRTASPDKHASCSHCRCHHEASSAIPAGVVKQS